MSAMNKKNLPLILSVVITTLFFTFVFYMGFTNLNNNYRSFRMGNIADATLSDDITVNDARSIQDIEDIETVALFDSHRDSAKVGGQLLAINYQDQGYNSLIGDGILREGRFPEKGNEIVVSKSLQDQLNLRLGSKIEIEKGIRYVDGQEIDSLSTLTDKEEFITNETKEYTIVGFTENVYNKMTQVHYGATMLKDNSKNFNVLLRFNDFEDAYLKKDEIVSKIEEKTGGKTIDLNFVESVIRYYGVDKPIYQRLLPKLVTVFSVIGVILLFVFFIKNIFTIWGIRKIRELSIYKSIGSTDFQIYTRLLKEAIWTSIMPIFFGHMTGYFLINKIYQKVQTINGVEMIEKMPFNTMLSACIVLVSLITVLLSVIAPARKISKINIIDGIKGNFNIKNIKRRQHDNLWKELQINNSKTIISQRSISILGVFIVSIFIIVLAMAMYYREYGYFEKDYNITITYISKQKEIPSVLEEIVEMIPNQKAYISTSKYITAPMELEFADEFKDLKLDKDLIEEGDRLGKNFLEGRFYALDDQAFKEIGGKKGEVLLLNKTQKDPKEPLSKAIYIPYFKPIDELNYRIYDNEEGQLRKIKIDQIIDDLKGYQDGLLPFQVRLYTDLENYQKLMKDWNKEYKDNYGRDIINYYSLEMKINDEDLKDSRELIETRLNDSISYDERYNILTGDEIKTAHSKDIKSLSYMMGGFALIIFILNVANGYSSINLSLLNRKKEIGTLYSCGMDKSELKKNLTSNFIMEQIISFFIVILLSIILIFIISILSWTLTPKILFSYFDYLIFILFAGLIYGVNILIHRSAVNKILNRPVIEVIK
jgi:putative ABC transport system permease protein